MNPRIRHTVFPVLAAFIWGTAFVAQSVSTDYVGAFTFNMLRSAIAAVVLSLGLFLFQRVRKQRMRDIVPTRADKKKLLVGGVCCGVALTVASNFQQLGLSETSAGKAGFITALYIVLVPVLGLFLRKKVPLLVWGAVVVAVIGLYCLCIREDFSVALSDLYVLFCAFVFAVHILLIDHFAQHVNGVALSCVQFVVVTLLSGIGALCCDTIVWENIWHCAIPLLYVGVFSSGVAYTLQILAQKDANPTVVSLLLSLESVFSVFAGAVLLKETMSGREYLGCVLMLIAVVAAQLPTPSKNT